MKENILTISSEFFVKNTPADCMDFFSKNICEELRITHVEEIVIDISSFETITQAMFACPSLKKLVLWNNCYEQWGTAYLEVFIGKLSLCHNLESICITHSFSLKDNYKAFARLIIDALKRLPNLQSVMLSKSYKNFTNEIEYFKGSTWHLGHFESKHTTWGLVEEILLVITELSNLKQLKIFDVIHGRQEIIDIFTNLMTSHKLLTSVTFSYDKLVLTTEQAEALSACISIPQLREIHFRHIYTHTKEEYNFLLSSIAQINSELNILGLHECLRFDAINTDANQKLYNTISKQRQLSVLEIQDNWVKDWSSEDGENFINSMLAVLPNLTILRVSRTKLVEILNVDKIFEKFCMCLQEAYSLKILDLSNNHLYDLSAIKAHRLMNILNELNVEKLYLSDPHPYSYDEKNDAYMLNKYTDQHVHHVAFKPLMGKLYGLKCFGEHQDIKIQDFIPGFTSTDRMSGYYDHQEAMDFINRFYSQDNDDNGDQ